MKTKEEIIKTIKKEDKFGLAYILDYLLPHTYHQTGLDTYYKKELQEKLIKLMDDELYLDKISKLNSYN